MSFRKSASSPFKVPSKSETQGYMMSVRVFARVEDWMLCQQGLSYPPAVEFFITYPELYTQDQLFLNNLTYPYLNELNRSIQNDLSLRRSRSAADKETAHKSCLLKS